MNFTFSADQTAFRDAVSRFLMTEAAPEMLREIWETDAGRSPELRSRMAAQGRRPLCQDTGVAQVFLRVGLGVAWHRHDGQPLQSLQAVVNEAVRTAYGDPTNPLRATMVSDPLGLRTNTHDNTPATLHCKRTSRPCAINRPKLAMPGVPTQRVVALTCGEDCP